MALIPVRARGTFGNVDGSHTYKLEIRQNGHTGGVTTLRLDDSQRVRIEYLGGDSDAYDPIKTSRISFAFAVRTDAEKALLEDMENADMFEFAVVLKEDDVIQWRGFVYLEQLSKPIRYNGLITVQAADCLALLENSVGYPSRLSAIGIIQTLLRDNNSDRSGFYMSRLFNNGDEIVRSNLKWIDIWFSQYFKAYIWSITHYQNISNWYEYLETILRKYALRIFMGEGGVYWIDHVPQRYFGSSNFKEYNYDTGLSVGTMEPTSGLTSVDFEKDVEYVYTQPSSYRTQPVYNRLNFLLFSNAPADTFIFSAAEAILDSTNTLTVGDTYTNNSSTFEVIFIPGYLTQRQRNFYRIRQDDTIWMQRISGSNDPDDKGTLTKSTGSGPSSIDFSNSSRADKTVVADFTEDIINDSFYVLDIPEQNVLSYKPPTALADSQDINQFKYAGFNGVSQNVFFQGLVANAQEFGTTLRSQTLDVLDLITGGEFQNGDESNWTANGITPTTPNADGTMRLTRIATSAMSDDSVYQAITTVGSEDYIAILELTNAVPDANTRIWRFGAENSTSIIWASSSLGETSTTASDQEYLLFEFTATAGTTYIHIGTKGGTAGDYADFSNCKVIRKDNLTTVEALLIDELKQHYRKGRKLYNLTFRSDAFFNNSFVFGDDILIPNSMTFIPKLKEISGDFVSIANDDFIYWAGTSFTTLLNNGKPNNSVSKPTGNQSIESQQILLGGYFDLEFYTTDQGIGGISDTVVAVGINDTATGTGSTTATTLDYSWYLIDDVGAGQSRIKVYEGGVQKYTEDYAFDSSDKFNIVYDGSTIRYYLNDTLKYTSLDASNLLTNTIPFPVNVRCHLNTNNTFGVQKVKLRGQCMLYPYAE